MSNMIKNSEIIVVSPNVAVQKNDVFTTGVIYMPVSLAYFSGELKKQGLDVAAIDAFGEAPNQFWIEDQFIFRGITPQEVSNQIGEKTKVIVFYAINLTYHLSLIKIIDAIKKDHPHIKTIVMENSQAVTAYSLRRVQHEFYQIGIDYVITGDPEERGTELIKAIVKDSDINSVFEEFDGLGRIQNEQIDYKPADKKINELDELAFPAWDLFPLKNYWKLQYAHGPVSAPRYLPLLTSRGCPYKCEFCVIPETSDLKWRSRSAKSVVDEIEYMQKHFDVHEYHIEDVDPTVNDKRTKAICQEIIDRKLNITWKIVAGTKVETMRSNETIELMAKSGCSYISVSPESGSPELMKKINKPFKLDHCIKLAKVMSKNGIYTQACFVLGFPEETDEDRQKTKSMIKHLTKNGIDEIAIFIVTPVPGSKIYDQFSGYSSYSELNFSPEWRNDYEKLNKFRVHLYRMFLIWKLIYHPFKILQQPFRFLSRSFKTKMEMVPFRALHTMFLLKGWTGKKVKYQGLR